MDQDFAYFKKRIWRTLGLVGLLFFIVNCYGTIGFMILEKASFFDAFYMTAITITTVGYSEVLPLHPYGRVFAISTIYIGLISSGFSVALLANLFFEETLLEIFKGRAKESRLNKISDHFIVCGYGTTGRGIVSELLSQGHQVVVIDEKVYDHGHEGCTFMQGDARKDDVLKRAGIERAAGLASTLSEDADNVFVVLCARELNEDIRIVSRFKDDDSESKLRTAGVDQAISPYRMGGHRLALALTNPPFLEVLDAGFKDTQLKVGFRHLHVPEHSPLSRKLLKESDIRNRSNGALIVAITDKQGNTTFNPAPDYHLRDACQLLLLADDHQVTALRAYLKGEMEE